MALPYNGILATVTLVALYSASIQLRFSEVSASPALLAPVVSNESCPTALSDQSEVLKSSIEEILRKLSSINGHCLCGDSSGEWIRVAHLNMSDPLEDCPANLTLGHRKSYRWCDMPTRSKCHSIFFHSPEQQPYSHVCGKVVGYQKGSTNAFNSNIELHVSLESWYLDGVSLTHGAAGSRQHIWSFAAAISEDDYRTRRHICPCIDTDIEWTYRIPDFIRNDYFCDTGASYAIPRSRTVVIEDPLWDGEGCGPSSSCCSFNNPPWFCKALQHSTTDPIELRLCSSDPEREASVISFVEIYVM